MADINDLSGAPNYRSEALQRIDAESNITRVAPGGISPNIIEGAGPALVHGENTAQTASAYSSARHGIRALGESLTKIVAAVEEQKKLQPIPGQILGNRPGAKPIMEMAVPTEKVAEVSSACNAEAMRALSNMKRAADQVDAALTGVNEQLGTKMVHPRAERASVIQQQAEIRAYVSKLPDDRRVGWLQSRISGNKANGESPDADVAFAVLNSSPWIVGLTPEQQASLREIAEQVLAPTEYARRAALASVKTKMDTATRTFVDQLKKHVPSPAQLNKLGQPALDALKGRAA